WKKGRKCSTSQARPSLIGPCTGRPSVVICCHNVARLLPSPFCGAAAGASSQLAPPWAPSVAAPQASGAASAGAAGTLAALQGLVSASLAMGPPCAYAALPMGSLVWLGKAGFSCSGATSACVGAT